MPIPLFLIAAGGVTAAVGVGKTIKAGVDQKDAKDTNETAQWKIDTATEKINLCRENCGNAIDSLGNRKISILDESIKPFITEFEKLNHVELKDSVGLNELEKMCIDKKSMSELKELQVLAASITKGVASGTVAGAITAFGAYGAASTFAVASTGTTIASLSGAAATNATLAFFGGGSLAAGGLGMAGGTAVLGGLVAGPALAVMGFVVGAKASKNKEEAYENYARAKEYAAEMDVASAMCIGIRKRTAMFERFLISLNSIFVPLVHNMTEIISSRGTDFREFTDDEKKVVAESIAIAGTIKSIIDTPILDEAGNLTIESEKMIDIIRENMEKVGL